jgi:hypothetical protein
MSFQILAFSEALGLKTLLLLNIISCIKLLFKYDLSKKDILNCL